MWAKLRPLQTLLSDFSLDYSGRPGLPVPNSPYGLCGRPGLPVPNSPYGLYGGPGLPSPSLIVRTVSVDVLGSPSLIVRTVSVDVLGSPSLIVCKVSVDVKQYLTELLLSSYYYLVYFSCVSGMSVTVTGPLSLFYSHSGAIIASIYILPLVVSRRSTILKSYSS